MSWEVVGDTEVGGPSRVLGPWRILPGLEVFVGESAISTPSPAWGHLPPEGSRFRTASMGQGPVPVQAPLPGRVLRMLWQQDTGGTVPHAGTSVQLSCAPVQTSMGESSRLGVTPLSLSLDSDSGSRLCTLLGADNRRGLVLTMASAPFASHQAGFLGLL